MKHILTLFLVLLSVAKTSGQITQITNFSGSATYGSRTVTVTSTGSVTTYVDPCLLAPTTYWIGQIGPSSYTYTFSSPVYGIWCKGEGLNTGEYIKVTINGSAYSFSPADFTSYTICPGGGPCFLSGGLMYGPTSGYDGAEFTVPHPTMCGGVTSVTVFCNGTAAGYAYHIGFDSTRPNCAHAISVSPCIGDSVTLDMTGDSTGATYSWSGPGGFTSTLQNPFIYPSVFADSGLYHVIRTVGLVSDTDSTFVHVYPKPILNVSNNAPLCTGILDTLKLNVTPFSTGETFSWSGPNGFTSTLQFPIVPGFVPVDTGVYTVIGTTVYGCKDTAHIDAGVVPPPPAPGITGKTQYCYGDPFVPFGISSIGTVLWYPTAASTTGSAVPPVVNTSSAGTYTYYADQTIGSCESPKGSITVIVYPQIVPAFTPYIKRGCNGDNVDFVNSSTGGSAYLWHFGDATPPADSANEHHFYTYQDAYNVTLTVFGIDPVCSLSTSQVVDTRHSVKAMFTPVRDTICIGDTSTLVDGSTVTVGTGAGQFNTYSWSFGDGGTDATIGTAPVHTFNTPGILPAKLVVTDTIGCSDTFTRNMYVIQLGITSFHDTMLCLSQPLVLTNTISQYPDLGLRNYTYHWTPGEYLTDASISIPSFNGFGLITYTVYDTLWPFGCAASDTIRINSVKGAPITNVTSNVTIPYGNSIQLNASNEIYYHWLPDDGSIDNPNISNPVATPGKSTIYTVYGYDVNGCLDSAFVNVNVDTTMVEDLPGGFTPNGDGLNDVFHLIGLKYQRLVEFRIFNRWGQQVFYTTNYKEGWDGTYNGTPQDLGVYFYTVTVARPGGTGDNIVYKGEVTLIR